MRPPKFNRQLITLAFFPLVLFAQTDPVEPVEDLSCTPADMVATQKAGITLLTDQDVFSPFNEDRNYTMGVGFRFFGKRADKPYWLTPLARQVLDRWFIERPIKKAVRKGILLQDCELTQDVIDFFVSGFTPLDIAEKAVIPEDRPYACLVGFGSTRGRSFNNGGTQAQKLFVSSSFYLGILGTHLGKAVQTHIHRNHWLGSTRPEPEGWNNQISDGGELTFMYRLGVTKPLVEWNTKPKNPQNKPMHLFQYSTSAEVYAGYYTQAAFSLNLRLGYFDHDYFQMTDTYSAAGNSAPNNGKRKIQAFVFFQPRARFVLYNALLQGQFAPSAHRFSFDEISHSIFDWDWGLCLSFWKIDLVYIPDAGRTREFDSPLARNHRWATAYFHLNF